MKLTTIKKTAPLALLAVAISGSAFAGHNDRHNPGGPPDKGDAQASVDVFTLCDVVPSYDKDTGALVGYDLEVETTITNTSGDTPVDALLSEISVQGTQKTRGKPDNLGPATVKTFDPAKAISDEYVSTLYIPICGAVDKDRDTSLNAEIEVTIDNSKFGTFSGQCDDDPSDNTYLLDDQGNMVLDMYGDPIVLEYGPDQSDVKIYGGTCL